MNGNDPLRMLYVGVLSTLLLLTGCLGFFGEDVIDSTKAEVSDDDFQTLQSTVSGLDALVASHSTDMVDLQVRVVALEAAMAPDDGYATQASLDIIDAKVTQLQNQYNVLTQNSNGGQNTTTTSNNALPIIDFHFDIEDDIYDQDDIAELLNAGFTDAGSSTVTVYVECSVFHPEGEAISSIGLDYNHDGITDITLPMHYRSVTGFYRCGGTSPDMWEQPFIGVEIPVTAFQILEDAYSLDGIVYDAAFLTLGAKAQDASGDVAWDVRYNVDAVISYQDWMGFSFTLSDHASMISSSTDALFQITYQGDDTIGIGTGENWQGYTDVPNYYFTVHINSYNDYQGYTYCSITEYSYNCKISEILGGGGNNLGYELYDGGSITISETYYYEQICFANWYYSDNMCELQVEIRIYENIDRQSTTHLHTYNYILDIM